ncbi:MAG: hypothetical protein ACK4UO_13090 [Pseudolabrys sp.]
MATITKKKFQEMLNANDAERRGNQHGNLIDPYRNNQYGPTKRLYGDYLRSCDREMFDANYREYLNGGHQELKRYE